MTMNRNDELYLEMTSDEAIFAIEINNAEGNSKKSERFYSLFNHLRIIFIFSSKNIQRALELFFPSHIIKIKYFNVHIFI